MNLPVVKKIIADGKKQKVYKLVVEDQGEEWSISISEDAFVRFHPYKGMEISLEEMAKITHEERIQQAMNTALNYLSYRKRSEKEVRDYLEGKGFSTDQIDKTVERLEQNRYIDDVDFAESYINTQVKTSDKGILQIQRELENKGIAEDIIVEKLSLYPEDVQLEKAIRIAEKYAKRKRNVSLKQLQAQIQMTLQRKGYPFPVIQQVIHELLQEVDEKQDQAAIRQVGQKALRKYQRLSEQERNLKIKQYLYRRGFTLDDIDDYLSEIREES